MLCDLCIGLLDLDNFPTSDSAYKHHPSYTSLCASAASGCSLCQLIRKRQNEKQKLEDNFDAEYLPEETQIEVYASDRKENTKGIWKLRFRQHELSNTQWLPGPARWEKGHLFVFLGVGVDEGSAMGDIVRGRIIGPDSASNSTFNIAKRWIRTCLEKHPQCLQNFSVLPTRVLDIGDDKTQIDTVSLKITNGEKGTWVTLSHCWGGKQPLTTTRDTLDIRCKGIRMDHLPVTFRDAVVITRRLGFRYLWIDSLCILQDSLTDWLSESSSMREVYQNATLNISADATPDSEAGIFECANSKRCLQEPLLKVPCRSSKEGLHGTLAFIALNTVRCPLQSRAWVLQEVVFSKRRLRYCPDMIEWSCETTRFCDESDPIMERRMGTTLKQHSLFQITTNSEKPRKCEYIEGENINSQEKRGQDIKSDIMNWWYLKLNDYLGRQITYIGDRLPAVAGIAKGVSERTGFRYRAGIWEENAISGLLWSAPGVGVDLKNGPSWSWMVLDPKVHLMPNLRDCLKSYASEDNEPLAALAEIRRFEVENVNNDPFGQVLKGRVVVHGRWRNVVWDGVPEPFLEKVGKDRRNILHRHMKNEWNPDRRTEVGQIVIGLDRKLRGGEDWRDVLPRDAIYLQMSRFGANQPDYYGNRGRYSLVLEPAGEVENEFRRIGVAQIPEDNGMADGWPERTVTII